ncbi:sensor histidine kinase [Gemmatimonas phototrophica]|uniref:sensor histidine kinase n=1 Tax=Gemmatimonas phototrophica TaxID=1379270 RepID=UPI0004799785|nr:ATP-binding protein [Gemmatimonas phototrophica]
MPVRFDDLSSFDKINLGATLIQTAVMFAFALAVTGVWLTHRRPAMRVLAGYWAMFAAAAAVNVFSSWSGAVWRDRVLSLSLTTVVVALHAAAVPFANESVRRLSRDEGTSSVVRASVGVGLGVLLVHGLGVWTALTWWPEVRLVPVLLSRSLHAAVFIAPAAFAIVHWRTATQNRLSALLLALGLSALAARGLLELALGFRFGQPELSALAVASAILFNLLGLMTLGVASLIAMAAEEQEVVHRQSEELRRAEQSRQQGQRLESLGRLASGVAHDFNNVLAVVMVTADNLRDEAITTSQREDIESLSNAAERGRGLVKQLLTFSRQQPVSNDIFEVNAHLLELESMLQRLAGDMTLRLEVGAIPTFVRMDRVNYDQLMLNLVVNARDASRPNGRIELSLRVWPTPKAGILAARGASSHGGNGGSSAEWICVAVEDFGSGIPAEVLPYVFEPFFSTKSPDRGTGLGLATVLGIVARAGGDVVVESEPGKGTRFEIWLPSVEAAVPLASVTA